MGTTVALTKNDGAKMEQRNLAKNGLWGQNTNIQKKTVACVEKQLEYRKIILSRDFPFYVLVRNDSCNKNSNLCHA